MAILAFDTSMRSVSVAVAIETRIVARLERPETGPAEALLPLIQSVMADAGVRFSDITRIATTLGPGGFTGIRVGLSMARGLALATGAELVGAGSLEIMAAAHPERPVVIAADAGRGAVYLQRFIEAMTDARPRLIETTADALALNVPAGVAIAGPGAARLLELLGRNDPPAAADLQPHAHALAECAARLTPDAHLRPMYIRAADAKPSTPSLFAPALETP